MMSLWDALRMNMMISYQELVRTFPRGDGECPFCEVRCCYGCLYYRPFTDGDHQAVLESVVKEVDELISISDSVGNARNPLISIHETTQFEIQSVIARCRFHQEKGGVR